MRYILIIACLSSYNACFAQAEVPPELTPRNEIPAMVIDPVIAYPRYDLNKYIKDNCHYPDSARKAGIQGRVGVTFVVNEKGAITDAKVVHGIGYGCDEEVLRLIRKMPRWKPAKEGRKAIKTTMIQVVKFSLD